MTPMELNRNSGSFKKTMSIFFSWKDFLSDLVPSKRAENIKYYLANCSFPLIRYKLEIQNVMKENFRARFFKGETPKIDRNVVNVKRTKKEAEYFRLYYYINYAVDDYQLNSMSRIIKLLRGREIKPVVVLMPLSKDLRQVLGRKNLELFINAVYLMANKNKAPILDYLSSCSGEEYEYYDGAHLTLDSGKRFTEKLGKDLK